MEEILRKNMLDLAAAYTYFVGSSPQAIGQAIMKDNTFFRRIAEGAGFTAATFDRVVAWFDENWPDADWPDDIPRPSQTTQPRPGRDSETAAVG
jgi:hypothetical protein